MYVECGFWRIEYRYWQSLTTPSPIACTVHGINAVAPIWVDIVVQFTVPNDIANVAVSSATAFGLPSAFFAVVSGAAANLPLLPWFFELLLAALAALLLLPAFEFCRSDTISLLMSFCSIFGNAFGDALFEVDVPLLLLSLTPPILRPILPDWNADGCCIGDTNWNLCVFGTLLSVGVVVVPANGEQRTNERELVTCFFFRNKRSQLQCRCMDLPRMTIGRREEKITCCWW